MPSFSLPIMSLFSDPLLFLRNLLLSAPAILIALTLHELAHGLVAYWCGDPTAKMMGRLSLNPLRHLDPIGTAVLVLVGFGYAKPVPVNPRYFKKPRLYDFFVSIAGITMNMILFALFGMAYFSYINFASDAMFNEYIAYFLFYCAQINACLAVFNVLPLPPLDGYHMVNDLLLKRPLFASEQQARIGQGILFLLILTGLLDKYIAFCVGGSGSGLWGGLFHIFKGIAQNFV